MDNTPISATDMPEGEYAIVEALGHRTLIGRTSEVERFGTKMLQVEPLFGDVMLGPVLLGGASIYQFATVPALALPNAEEGEMLFGDGEGAHEDGCTCVDCVGF